MVNMTRRQFDDTIEDWDDLITFCGDNNYDEWVEDIYSEDAKDEYYDEDLVEMAENADSWQDLRDILSNLPDGYDDSYYHLNEYGEMDILYDDDFEELKQELMEAISNNDDWEEDDEEDESEYELLDDDLDDIEITEDDECEAEDLAAFVSFYYSTIDELAKLDKVVTL